MYDSYKRPSSHISLKQKKANNNDNYNNDIEDINSSQNYSQEYNSSNELFDESQNSSIKLESFNNRNVIEDNQIDEINNSSDDSDNNNNYDNDVDNIENEDNNTINDDENDIDDEDDDENVIITNRMKLNSSVKVIIIKIIISHLFKSIL